MLLRLCGSEGQSLNIVGGHGRIPDSEHSLHHAVPEPSHDM